MYLVLGIFFSGSGVFDAMCASVMSLLHGAETAPSHLNNLFYSSLCWLSSAILIFVGGFKYLLCLSYACLATSFHILYYLIVSLNSQNLTHLSTSFLVRVGRQVVNIPSFMVRVDSQKHIDFSLASPFGGGRPGRVKRKNQKAAAKKASGGDGGEEDEEWSLG